MVFDLPETISAIGQDIKDLLAVSAANKSTVDSITTVGTSLITAATWGDVLASLPVGTAATANIGTSAGEVVAVSANGTLPLPPFILVKDVKPNGSTGQSLTANTWVARNLNTIATNTITGASLASDQITLPAGTYDVEATAPGFLVNSHVTRLQDATNGVTLVEGTAENSHSSFSTQTHSMISGRFTLSGTSALELQHMVVTSNASGGGSGAVPTGYTGASVFSQIKITMVA